MTDAVKDELIRRREDYARDPERFLVLNADELDGFFEGVRKEVQQRVEEQKAKH